MKKYLVLILAAVAALVSCGKEILVPETDVPENINETVQATSITFNLSANHPDATKAVKSGWESGDAIFVFFSGATAPKHLKMTFDGTSWTSAEYDGTTLTPDALGLQNGDTGTMRAVFLPFVSGKTLSSHNAVKLPANDNVYAVVSGTPNEGKWVPVGSEVNVAMYKSDLTTSLGTWYTCNYGQAVPESPGSLYTFDAANALGVSLPTYSQLKGINDNCSYTLLTVHGQLGAVFKAARGFLFLPYTTAKMGCYWSSTEYSNPGNAFYFYFYDSSPDVAYNVRSREFGARPAFAE